MIRTVAGVGSVRLASLLASFLVGVQLARQLGLEDYGLYSVAFSVVTVASIPGELGLGSLVTREVATASAKNEPQRLFGILQWAKRTCWQVTAVLMIMIVGWAILTRHSHPTLAWAILFGAPTIPLMALSRINGGALQGLQHIIRGQLPANLFRPALLSAFLVTAFLGGVAITPAIAMLLYSITAGVVFAVAATWARNRLPPRDGRPVIVQGRQWLASTIPFALIDGMRMLQAEVTVLLLGFLASPAEAGLFRIAIVSATAASVPLGVMTRATMPIIARLYVQDQRHKLASLLRYSAFVQTGGVILLSLPLLLAPEFLLSMVFGPKYAAAATALRIASLAQIANAAFGLNSEILNMTHNEGRVTRAMAIGLALNIVAVGLLAQRMGIAGAALGFAISVVSWNVLTWLDSRSLLGLETSVFRLGRRRSC